MKFVISLLICLSAQAAPITIFYEDKPDHALMIKDTLVGQYKIPEDLMSLLRVDVCEEVEKQLPFGLCLKSNGDLYVVSVDREFVNESLKIFRAP